MSEPTGDHDWWPLLPSEVASLFEGAAFPWCIAGGHAVEHAVGRPLRAHADIDVLVLRRHQLQVRGWLADWDCRASHPSAVLSPWDVGEILPTAVHDVWCRPVRAGPWRLQVILDEGDEGQWRSRRNGYITLPLSDLMVRSESGIPFLAVAVQLFYKAKAPRPKDEDDFAAALPLLTASEKSWLGNAILKTYGANNAWLKMLAE